MKISDRDVLKIAGLAKIKILSGEIPKIAAEVEKIIGFIDRLNEIDCEEVEPLSGITVNRAYEREDIVDDGDYADDIVGNAPEQASNMFAVPKIVE
jgi:aspartyl-tRNA(Asn)/glutamyl-tRNA(Gln) amidotransferase subunit C